MNIKLQTIQLYHTLETAIAERDALTNDEILQDLRALGYIFGDTQILEAKLKWTDVHTDLLHKLTPAYTMFKSSSSNVERKSRTLPPLHNEQPHQHQQQQVSLDTSSPEEISDAVLNSVVNGLHLPNEFREAMQGPLHTVMRQLHETLNADSSTMDSLRPSS